LGTIQDPNPDRDWLERSYVHTSANPYSIDAPTEMMGHLAEVTGGSRVIRVIARTIAVVTLFSFAASIVVGVLRLL
jgi:hypothetical protein